MRFLFALCCLFSLLTTISATISGRIYQGPGCTGMLISTRSNITSGECLLNDDRTTYSSVTCNAQGIATFAWFTGSDCQTGQYASGGGQGDGVTCMNIQIQTATISGYVNCNEAGDATTTTPTTVMPTTAVPVITTTPPTTDMPTTAVPTTSIPTTLAPTTTTPVTTQPPKILAIAFMLRVNQDYNTITIDAQTKTNWINNFIAALCRNMGILFRCSRLQVINLVPGSVVVTTVVTPPMENEPTQISTTTATSNLLAALNNSQSDLRQTLPMDPTLFNSTTIQSCDDGSFTIACVPVLSSTGSSGSISSTGSVSTYTGPRYNDTVTSSSSTVYSSSIIYVVIMMIALVTLFN